jgi:predicted RNA-binding Zn ribbon-like protein
MATAHPRYDLPNAAPPPLRIVQEFVNTANLERENDWLASFFEQERISATADELVRAREVREAIRELLYENNGFAAAGDGLPTLNRAAREAGLSIDFERGELVPSADGVPGAVGRVLAAAFTAMAAGSWKRLKACKNHGCRWAFYDYSRNRSASWCSMKLCGNRTKTRAYRHRRRTL